MEQKRQSIRVSIKVVAPLHVVWHYWTDPTHIVNWNTASDDWHTVSAVNDLKGGGWFSSRMEAKDGSVGFDFEGRYDEVVPNEKITYTLSDGRKVKVIFKSKGNKTEIEETFQAEDQNSIELQQQGWQAILDRFKYYVELNEK
ncbi:SRPBCC domain-containing protein [Dysgonomonas sp. Marseille-P4677]|uniref:SRPBCC domain-containing protein n=1 Tax=Dysgonomonas sp. Marseille-P4677 TaxID=2364790 RepID=UPI0019113485|nr:SRPBCC domain-containing protein [Dysgonomonas sp. Marseille-P4677]MBK5721844.1 SRPBCC domain-containing protein [Dysgonomonas sp. Marseille-P4677]